MTIEQLYEGLSSIGLPVAYGEFEENNPSNPVPDPPYIVYIFTDDDDLFADNNNYLNIGNYQIELYTNHKSPTIEKQVQDKLKEMGLTYSRVGSWIPEEKMFQMIYTTQLIGG